ncbi:MAG: pyridoxal phosphate-dependent aminotransferase [Desulfobacterales bacterium]|nr:pyridoxal phosphate-dependent aminotransferase [Desulfobacterales bacterium]
MTTRIKDLSSFLVMDILEKAHELERQGRHIIHLEVGEPDFDTPSCITDAADKALKDGYTHYTHSLGIIELREAICEFYKNTYNVSISPGQVLVTSGTSPAMLLAFSALLEKSDEVIISDPHYACYPNFIKYLDAIPVMVPVFEDDGFQYRTAAIQEKITEKTRAILINSPSNPTGTLLSEERMKKIARLSPMIVSDEIYHGLVYEGMAHSILEYTDNAFVFNGFSKLYAMTGFRLGYVIAPEAYIRPMQILQQNFFISANAASQLAGIAALKKAGEDVAKMNRIYNERRKYLISRLRDMGFSITVEPTGAMYVFVNMSHISKDSYHLAFDILEKAGVGVTPGIDFGQNSEGYIRFSYANSLENIKEGMNRLEAYLANKEIINRELL